MTLQPILFSARPRLVRALAGAAENEERVCAVVVDWEVLDPVRSAGQSHSALGPPIGSDSEADLRRAVELSAVPVICRINRWSRESTSEIDRAVGSGASEILLPMVRTPREVELALKAVAERADLGVMVETPDAICCARELGQLPLRRVFVGLMDLALELGSRSLFDPLVDGTVERLRAEIELSFGCAGLTLPGHGRPVPSRLVAAELVRLGCDFSFLRRSFLADMSDRPARDIAAIRRMLRELEARGADEIERDRRTFVEVVRRACR